MLLHKEISGDGSPEKGFSPISQVTQGAPSQTIVAKSIKAIAKQTDTEVQYVRSNHNKRDEEKFFAELFFKKATFPRPQAPPTQKRNRLLNCGCAAFYSVIFKRGSTGAMARSG